MAVATAATATAATAVTAVTAGAATSPMRGNMAYGASECGLDERQNERKKDMRYGGQDGRQEDGQF